ncbi:MAG TPA: MFS transporter [Polyangiales bacterium]|nr:MFS transporter [Polyangiales bacterium]
MPSDALGPSASQSEPVNTSAFRSLRNRNYRLWALGGFVSNVGTWMQRTAQDWLVLTQLTHHNASAVGTVMALQFGPQVLLLPLTGYAADHWDRRKSLVATQALLGLLALGLGLLTVSGVVQIWHVYVFALLVGCVAAFDMPARQTFVSDLVGERDLANAVALNATSFHAARMVGPAVAGAVIAALGTGWAFLVNGASYVGVLCALSLLRSSELHVQPRGARSKNGLADGFRYVAGRPDLVAILCMVGLIGTFGFNFAIFISTMSVRVFHAGVGGFGLMTSCMAVGSVLGALLSARRARPRIALLMLGAGCFGLGCSLAAHAPSYLSFGVALALIGLFAQTFTTSANSLIQLSTEPSMRGRVLAILLAITLGGTPLGAPLVGYVADVFGPRWALDVAGLAAYLATLIGIGYLVRHRNMRLRFKAGRLRLGFDDE